MGYLIETKYEVGDEIKVPVAHCKTAKFFIVQVLVFVNEGGSEIRYYINETQFVSEEEVLE